MLGGYSPTPLSTRALGQDKTFHKWKTIKPFFNLFKHLWVQDLLFYYYKKPSISSIFAQIVRFLRILQGPLWWGARGAIAPQHFEIYLIGTNFVFKKLKFYIDSSPRNFFSPPKLKMPLRPLTFHNLYEYRDMLGSLIEFLILKNNWF